MRFATYLQNDIESFGLVLRHPREGVDWIFNPREVVAVARTLSAFKGSGYTWWRPDFEWEGGWPRTLSEFLAAGGTAMDTARRLQDFLRRYLEQGDPQLFVRAGAPLASVDLQAPIPEPRLLLGVVGNCAGFLRMDPARGRNLHEPKCHQRPQTSVVGPGQPIVLPAGCEQWAGTTELGVVIGRRGRDIPREEARAHIGGYTVINDGLGSLFTRRWTSIDREAGDTGFHYHASNAASWLDKKTDTMLAMGPWLVTPEEVGDPYDLLSYYREGGVTRNRAHSGALCCGIEELIFRISRFLTLEPGDVLHLGAMGQDGIPAAPAERFGADYFVECEIERVGNLRNPLVAPVVSDWRPADDPGRTIHPAPVVRALIAKGRTQIERTEDWKPECTRHFWTLLGNSRESLAAEGIAPKLYPLAYNAPSAALAASGRSVVLRDTARTISGSCELGVVIGTLARNVSADDALRYILGYVTLAVLRDSSFREALIAPHILQASIPDICSRWPEGFNVVSASPIALADFRGRRMRFAIDDLGESEQSTDIYRIDPSSVVAELSRGITLLPGDVIAMGFTGGSVEVGAGRRLATGTKLHASIDGIGDASALLVDQRRSATVSS